MGKSPARWIKTVLFGKKSSRSNSTKKGVNDKANTGAKGPAFTESSPVISDPVLVSAHSNGANIPSGAKEDNSSIQENAAITPPVTNQEFDTQRAVELDTVENREEKIREEKAAVKAQAAFRGYLARRAFKALKGIIRLQALIRGHLVRRQAVASLRSIYSVVRFQALVRGNSVRSSNNGLGMHTKLRFTKCCSGTSTWKEYASANAFARKLISFHIKDEPLHFQYDENNPNSVFSWLSRWTIAKPWKPFSQPKKAVDAKPAARRSSYAMETESGKLKRNTRKTTPVNANATESSQTRNPKKFSAVTTSESVQESGSPLTELEKVKRNLRKVSSQAQDSMAEIESERTSVSVPVPGSNNNNNLDLSHGNLVEKAKRFSTGASTGSTLPEIKPKKDNSVVTDLQTKKERETPEIVVQNEKKPETEAGQIDDATTEAIDDVTKEEPQEEEVITASNEETQENFKTTKRRSSSSSLSVKPENTESNSNNNVPAQSNNSPASVVPSYMAMTASAKTKLRGSSPRFGSTDQGSGEKNAPSTRRHSLPSSASNGKLSSQSPRTQRPVHAKGGAKNDKSMHSSRDGADKLIVEWRR